LRARGDGRIQSQQSREKRKRKTPKTHQF
jgi:hypothetical protein